MKSKNLLAKTGIYYRHIIESVKTRGVPDRGGTLREAQLKLLRAPYTSHPYYRAAFSRREREAE